MALEIQSLYRTQNREIINITSDLDAAVSLYWGDPVYCVLTTSTRVFKAINISLLLSATQNLNLSTTYRSFINAKVTDLVIDTYCDPTFPLPNLFTGQYPNRIDVIDVNSVLDYQIGYGNFENPDGDNDPYQRASANDLVISRTDGLDLSNHLLALNGVVHKSVLVNQKLYLLDAYLSLKQTGKIDLVAFITDSVGGHTTVPITRDMLNYKQGSLAQKAVITVPSGTLDLTAVSVGLVIDGYLHLLDKTYTVESTTTISLNMSLLNCVQKFLHSPKLRYARDYFNQVNRASPYDDQTSPSVIAGDRGDAYLDMFIDSTIVDSTVVQSDDFLLSRLSSEHSFLVLIAAPTLYTKSYCLQTRGDTQGYEWNGPDMPRGVCFSGVGKTISYFVQKPDTQRHYIFTKEFDTQQDAYLTAPQVASLASPKADVQNKETITPVKLVEYYSGDAV